MYMLLVVVMSVVALPARTQVIELAVGEGIYLYPPTPSASDYPWIGLATANWDNSEAPNMGFSSIPTATSAHVGIRSAFSGIQKIKCYYCWYKISKRGGRIASPVLTKTWYFKCKGGESSSGNGSGNTSGELHIIPETLELEVGEEYDMSCWSKGLSNPLDTWSSNNTSIATIERTGFYEARVKAKSKGQCNIVVSADGLTSVCQLTVKEKLKNGDVILAKTEEGVEMGYEIIDVVQKTCKINNDVDRNVSGTITIPSNVNGFSVVEIGENAFVNCKKITKINFPNTITRIQESAFGSCVNLTSINGLDNVTMIEGRWTFSDVPWIDQQPDGPFYIGKVFYKYIGTMPKNTDFKVKEGTQSIAYNAGSYCSGLTSLYIPESVSFIEGSAFIGCKNLKKITVDAKNKYLDSRNNCNAIIYTSENTLFKGCMETIIPNDITSIGYDAFYSTNLTSIVIPDEVDSIAENAFRYCTTLKSLTIGKKVRVIDGNPFEYCEELSSINVSPSNTYYYTDKDLNAIIEKSTKALKVGCPISKIPSYVKIIGENAFTTSNKGFYSITIPDNVEEIQGWAFCNRENLQSVTIGKNVCKINRNYPFFGCKSLKIIVSRIEDPFDIDKDVFNCSDYNGTTENQTYENATLYVPVDTKTKYQSTAGWNNFKNIVEYDPNTFDPSTLGIHGKTTDDDKDTPVYNISGQRLVAPKKGINIVGGRKVIAK